MEAANSSQRYAGRETSWAGASNRLKAEAKDRASSCATRRRAARWGSRCSATMPRSPLAFSPDGSTLASADAEGTVFVWPVSVEAWKARACRMAGRPLTDEEIARFVGDVPYRPACRNVSEGEPEEVGPVATDMRAVPAGWFWMGCNKKVDNECYLR